MLGAMFLRLKHFKNETVPPGSYLQLVENMQWE